MFTCGVLCRGRLWASGSFCLDVAICKNSHEVMKCYAFLSERTIRSLTLFLDTCFEPTRDTVLNTPKFRPCLRLDESSTVICVKVGGLRPIRPAAQPYFSSSFSSTNNLACQGDACYKFPMSRIFSQRVYCLYLPLPVSPAPNTLLSLLTTVTG